MIIQLDYRSNEVEDTKLETDIKRAFGAMSTRSDWLCAWPDIMFTWNSEAGIVHYVSRTEAGALWLAVNAPTCAKLLEA